MPDLKKVPENMRKVEKVCEITLTEIWYFCNKIADFWLTITKFVAFVPIFQYGTIQIIRDTCLAYFRPPSPMCHLLTLARTPHSSPRVT